MFITARSTVISVGKSDARYAHPVPCGSKDIKFPCLALLPAALSLYGPYVRRTRFTSFPGIVGTSVSDLIDFIEGTTADSRLSRRLPICAGLACRRSKEYS